MVYFFICNTLITGTTQTITAQAETEQNNQTTQMRTWINPPAEARKRSVSVTAAHPPGVGRHWTEAGVDPGLVIVKIRRNSSVTVVQVLARIEGAKRTGLAGVRSGQKDPGRDQ